MRVIQIGLFDNRPLPLSPKQFEIVKINPVFASKLNAEWHSVLPKIHWSNITRNRNYICYGAIFDQRYFAVAIWSSPVSRYYDPDTVLELRRLAISHKSPKFTASWMLGKMVKMLRKDIPGVTRLISYQDKNIHTGTIYKAANWTPTGVSRYHVWWHKTGLHSVDQSTADKIRWEYEIRKN